MTEIQFLAQFILNDSIPQDVRKQLVDRIIELEQNKPAQIQLTTPQQFTYPINVTCQHEYPSGPWGSTVPPHCVKCGKQSPFYGVGSGAGGGSGSFSVTNGLKVI